jgi:DNA-binding beta-propeller fold protein YncE
MTAKRGVEMLMVGNNSLRVAARRLAFLFLLIAIAAMPAYAEKKKKKEEGGDPSKPQMTEFGKAMASLDVSKIVWPNPPAITRVKYLRIYSGEERELQQAGKKSGWMDRLSGVATGETAKTKLKFQLLSPYGLAVDSKNRLYVADHKVGAVFIFNTENKEVELIKHGVSARFQLITGLAIDDADRLYVSDSEARHVLVFNPQHKVEASINQGMSRPAGIAVDSENRFLYVCDTDLDQVLVYDADPPFKLLRAIGTSGKKHTLTNPGDFAYPTNVAVDADGNVFVSDTFNDRVEIFDADGNFVRTFGKAGDGLGYFARPKGIAVDSDGHVWVADSVTDRVQVFTQEGQLLLWMGGHGLFPGQFTALNGLAIDKNHRVFTSEQYIGRVQMFRYFTDDEARAEKAKRDAEQQKKSAGGKAEKSDLAPKTTAPVQSDAAAAKTQGSAAN